MWFICGLSFSERKHEDSRGNFPHCASGRLWSSFAELTDWKQLIRNTHWKEKISLVFRLAGGAGVFHPEICPVWKNSAESNRPNTRWHLHVSSEAYQQKEFSLQRRTEAEHRTENSRAVLVAPVEDQEGIRLAEEIFFVQLVPTKLHQHRLLTTRKRVDGKFSLNIYNQPMLLSNRHRCSL